jgi:hypothetical protein
MPLPLQLLAVWFGVWLSRVLQEQVDYLKAENRLLREKLGTNQVRLTVAERRRLATPGKALGRKGLAAVATIASPETILRWYRELVAKKYDGSQQRGQGRPKTSAEVAALVVRMALIDGKSQDVVGSCAVACRERLGGLLKFCYREAA